MKRRNNAWYFGVALCAVPACSNADSGADTTTGKPVDFQASAISPMEPLPADFPDKTLILRVRMIYPKVRSR